MAATTPCRLCSPCVSLRQAGPQRRSGCRVYAAPNVAPVDGSGGTHKYPPRSYPTKPGEKYLFQTGESMKLYELPEGTRFIYPGVRKDGVRDREKVYEMVKYALDNPIGDKPLKEKLRALVEAKGRSAKVVMAFDDVSVPLPPMMSPDIRSVIMDLAEQYCVEAGIEDIRFICSIALHRFIRPDEFRHICGPRLFDKYFPQGRMVNFNAVDDEHAKFIGKTRHDEDVMVCREFVEADLAIYANCNYVAMDGGYKSYATGMVNYRSLKPNHDAKTLMQTRSLYDPDNSAMHRSFKRIGSMIQKQVDIFHVETVLDDQTFPFYLEWVTKPPEERNLLDKALCLATVTSLQFIPLWLRKWTFWSFFVRGPFGLLQVYAGETVQVHEKTLEANYRDKVVDVDGQCDILILAPSCIGPYTKDMYMNPLLVNTYSLGYWYNQYVGGTPLLREGGVVIVVNDMPYEWSSPSHDGYREFFEEVLLKGEGALDNFEKYQDKFATNERLNDIYRRGEGPAGVHAFYMYTWAAHGMDKVGRVFVVGATDPRGPKGLGWETCDSVVEAVAKAREWLGDKNASATFWSCPPVGYARVKVDAQQKEPAGSA